MTTQPVRITARPEDIINASAHLADRAGARTWQLAWECPHLPEAEHEDHHRCDHITWKATAEYSLETLEGTAPTPHEAALALAVRLMSGAACRCGRDVTLAERSSSKRCQWHLDGDKWLPGCSVPPLPAGGARGDYLGMIAAIQAGGGRAARRAAARVTKRMNKKGGRRG